MRDAIDKLSGIIEGSLQKQAEMETARCDLVVLTLVRKRAPTGESILLLGSCGPRSEDICNVRQRADGSFQVTAYFDGQRCLSFLSNLREDYA